MQRVTGGRRTTYQPNTNGGAGCNHCNAGRAVWFGFVISGDRPDCERASVRVAVGVLVPFCLSGSLKASVAIVGVMKLRSTGTRSGRAR